MSIFLLNCNPELLYVNKFKFVLTSFELVTSSKAELEISTHDL